MDWGLIIYGLIILVPVVVFLLLLLWPDPKGELQLPPYDWGNL